MAAKHLHITCAVITICLFILRSVWSVRGTLASKGRWVRIVPHVNDTILLGSAIYLTTVLSQYPGTAGWLTAKFVGLLVYIGLGFVAIKFGKTPAQRALAAVGAVLVFAYIVGVARFHHPLSWAVMLNWL